MTNANLKGVKVTILVEDGFEQVELTEPRKALDEAGAETASSRPRANVSAVGSSRTGVTSSPSTSPLDQARPQEFDALLLPGGVMNPDKLRMEPNAVAFVKAFFDAGKPVAAICHGPWTLIETGEARGRRIASWPSLKTDLRERRRRVGGPGGGGRRQPRVKPQARRHPGVQPSDDRTVQPGAWRGAVRGVNVFDNKKKKKKKIFFFFFFFFLKKKKKKNTNVVIMGGVPHLHSLPARAGSRGIPPEGSRDQPQRSTDIPVACG